MKSLLEEHKVLWSNKVFLISTLLGVVFFIFSLFFNYFSLNYSIKAVGNSTTDILLDNLPVVNVDMVFSEGALLFVLFIFALFLFSPKIIPFTLKSIALFVCIRATFVAMTHLGIPIDHIKTDFDSLRYVGGAGADQFFSGHTGLPFLMSLLYWENKTLRWVFFTFSIIAGTAVLLGHLHYTIDVFAAFFISYTIYHIALKMFPKDRELFLDGFKNIKLTN